MKASIPLMSGSSSTTSTSAMSLLSAGARTQLNSRLVGGLELLGLLERQLVQLGTGVGVDGLGDETHVVAAIDLVEDLDHGPVGTVVDDRYVAGTGMPGAAGELVDLVAGVLTEQAGQRHVALVEEVQHEVFGPVGHAEGVILLGDPHEEPGRIDAALGVEANQT